MKHFTLTLFFVALGWLAHGQDFSAEWEREINYRKTGMTVLGTWAVANLASGLALRSSSEGSTRYFHEMNALWNTVNLGIATAGYIGAMRLGSDGGWMALQSEATTLDKTLLFNAGLDLAYMAGGLYMTERSRRVGENSDRWLGYGRSVMVQGAFLFLFDVGMVIVHPELQLPEGLSFGLAPGALEPIRLSYRF